MFRWTHCAVGVGDVNISLDALGGAVPLEVAWSMARWARVAIEISDARTSVNVLVSRCNRILKRMRLRIRVLIGFERNFNCEFMF